MLKTFVLALPLGALLGAPGSAQSLLDRMVTYAEGENRVLLVPCEIADHLEAVRPDTAEPSLDRRRLEGCLDARGARMTHVGSSSVVVHRPGSDIEQALLELHGPLVEPGELEGLGGDLVWTIARREPEAAELLPVPTGVLTAEIGDRRILGGAARDLRAALGERLDEYPEIGLVANSQEPRSDGPTLVEWFEELERDAAGDLLFTFNSEVQAELGEVRVWGESDPLVELWNLGFPAANVGPSEAGVIEVASWRPRRRNFHRGASHYIESPEELAGLESVSSVTLVLPVHHLEVRPIASALNRLDSRCCLMAASRENLLVMTGGGQALRRWCRVLEIVDQPR